jgi:hypothetical protein
MLSVVSGANRWIDGKLIRLHSLYESQKSDASKEETLRKTDCYSP